VRISAYQEMKDMKVKILQYLAPGGVIEIVGHTDNVPVHNSVYGSNEALSLARAQAVVKFFVTLLGMDEKSFKPIGKGDTMPVATNDTIDGRIKNRRVEIVIHGTAYE
jgi:chemotaxis protein MotB